MASLIDKFGFEIMTVTPASARRIGRADEDWGKGMRRAGLNFGDCFAYAAENENGCRLIYVGDDFSKTDIESVL